MTINLKWLTNFISDVESYKKIFKKDDGDVEKILADLARFAPVDPTQKVAKPYNNNEIYIMIGRRQMLSHILGKINMTQEELNRLVKQQQLHQNQDVNM